MIAQVKPEIITLNPPETHAMPVSAYHVQRLGSLSLNWCNTELVHLGDPDYNHVLHTGSPMPTLRFPIPQRYKEQLFDKGFPFSYYPSWDICRFWTEESFVPDEEQDTPEIHFTSRDREMVLTHLNSRLRTFRDTPDANHLEVRLFDNDRPTTFAFRFRDLGKFTGVLFREDFPLYSVPKLAMDADSLHWHQQRANAA